jgi:hypothetical protein
VLDFSFLSSFLLFFFSSFFLFLFSCCHKYFPSLFIYGIFYIYICQRPNSDHAQYRIGLNIARPIWDSPRPIWDSTRRI